jgi:hypothetical protein
MISLEGVGPVGILKTTMFSKIQNLQGIISGHQFHQYMVRSQVSGRGPSRTVEEPLLILILIPVKTTLTAERKVPPRRGTGPRISNCGVEEIEGNEAHEFRFVGC